MREHKHSIVSLLRRAIVSPLTRNAETSVRAWLARINETDAEIIEHVVYKCRRNVEARAYFLERAREESLPTRFSIDHIEAGTMRVSA